MPSASAIWTLLTAEELPSQFRDTVTRGAGASDLLKAGWVQHLSATGLRADEIATRLSAATGTRHKDATIEGLLQFQPRPAAWKIRFANLVSGRFTELVFRTAYSARIAEAGLELIEEAALRSFLDFRVAEPSGAFALALNVKNAGTQMRLAKKFFGLEPEDTLPIATYKAFGSEQAAIPPLIYVFLVDWTLIERLRTAYWLDALAEGERQVFRLLASTRDMTRNVEDAFIAATVDERLDRLLSAVGYGSLSNLPFHAISAGKCHRIFYDNHERSPYVYRQRMNTDPGVHVSVKNETIRFSDFIDRYLMTPETRDELLVGLARKTTLEVPDPPV